MKNPMNKTSARESAFLTPRVLAGCGFDAVAVALTLLAFFALPKHSARADLGYCSDPDVYYDYGGPTGILIDMDSATETDPSYECIVFYTTNGSAPTHSGATPTGSTLRFYAEFPAPYMQTRTYRARGWVQNYTDSVNITQVTISNPPN